MSLRLVFVALLLGVHLNACKNPDSGGTDSSSSSGTGSTSTGVTSVTTVTTTSTTGATTSTTSPSTSETGGSATEGASSGGVSASSSSSGTSGPPPNCMPTECMGAVYACGDCMDNDGDGKYDGADPECVSPCDDDEASFATGLPGDNMDPCKQDCFFDGNSGGGSGDCAWNLKCDPLSPGGDKCPYDPNFKSCPEMQPQQCIDNCQTPNGCDCFGCCTVVVNGMTYDIFLGDQDCSLANVQTCQMCTKNDQCDDPCVPENCEICFGQTEPPPGCTDPNCTDNGGMPCMIDMMGGSNCPADMFCQTGCCVPIVPG